MKKLFLTTVFFCIVFTTKGQDYSNLVLAKYKNGIFYVGEKIGQKDDYISLKINTQDTIQINQKKLSRYFDSNTALIYHNGKYMQTQGGFWDLSFGFNAQSMLDSADQRVSSHLEVIYGKRLSQNLNLGVGLGFEFNEAMVAGFQFDTQFVSLSAFGRYYLTNHSRRFFLFSRIGFGFPSEENQEGMTLEHSAGFQSINGIGIQFASRKRSNFILSLGFYTQNTSGREFFLDHIGNEVQTHFNITIKRLMIKLGWQFG